MNLASQTFGYFLKQKKIPFEKAALGLLTVHVVFIVLFFDNKVHVGGDDSDYIIAGLDFLQGDAFPSWHGIFYPIFLSPLIALAGINVVFFKIISALLSVSAFLILYQTFNGRIERNTLLFAFAITSCSYTLSLYASTTYSEPLFIFVQSLVFYFFFKLLDLQESQSKKNLFTTVFALAFTTFLLSITRNIGLGAMIIFFLYLLFIKRWKIAGLLMGLFIFFESILFVYKKFYWEITQAGIAGQFSRIGYKNFYNPQDGMEDVMGFIHRFWINSHVYLSKHFLIMLGLKKAGQLTIHPLLTLVLYALLIFTLIRSFQHNRYVFVTTLYVAGMLAVTFITQQVHWDQERLIMVYLPLLCILLGFLLQEIVAFREKLLKPVIQVLLIFFVILVFLRSSFTEKNIWDTLSNLNGRPYKGYSDEWMNYSLVSEWAGANIPATKTILCRKAGISGVYGKRKFTGISNFYYTVPDSANAFLLKKKIDYVILDKLQLPTVQRVLGLYLQKYPLGLKFIYSKGKKEPSYLFEVIREQPASDEDHLKRIMAGASVYPNQPYYYILAGDQYYRMYNFTQALTFYKQALKITKIQDEKSALQLQCAACYLYLDKIDESLIEAKKVISKKPKDKRAWELLAHLFQKKGMHAEAVHAASQAK